MVRMILHEALLTSYIFESRTLTCGRINSHGGTDSLTQVTDVNASSISVQLYYDNHFNVS